jgi:hypothetical protein
MSVCSFKSVDRSVFVIGERNEMTGVHTQAGLARVVKLAARWDRTDYLFVDKAVGEVPPDAAVAPRMNVLVPDPAARGRVDCVGDVLASVVTANKAHGLVLHVTLG